MVDNVLLYYPYPPPQPIIRANGDPIEWGGYWYYPKYLNGEIQAYEAKIKNLKVVCYPERVYVSNSLHKFFLGNNWGTFTRLNLKDAIRQLSEIMLVDIGRATVKKIEYGVNINTYPDTVIQSLISFKNKPYLPMASNGTIYGKVADFTEYRIKGYNKSFQVGKADGIYLNKPIFRFEVAAKNSRQVTRIAGKQLLAKDLFKYKTFDAMGNDLSRKFNQSMKANTLDLNGLTPDDIKLIAVMQNEQTRAEIMLNHKRTYRNYRAKYDSLIKKNRIINHLNLEGEIERIMHELLNL